MTSGEQHVKKQAGAASEPGEFAKILQLASEGGQARLLQALWWRYRDRLDANRERPVYIVRPCDANDELHPAFHDDCSYVGKVFWDLEKRERTAVLSSFAISRDQPFTAFDARLNPGLDRAEIPFKFMGDLSGSYILGGMAVEFELQARLLDRVEVVEISHGETRSHWLGGLPLKQGA